MTFNQVTLRTHEEIARNAAIHSHFVLLCLGVQAVVAGGDQIYTHKHYFLLGGGLTYFTGLLCILWLFEILTKLPQL